MASWQRAEGRGQTSKDRGQRAYRWHTAEGKLQRIDGRGQIAAGRYRQRAIDRERDIEIDR